MSRDDLIRLLHEKPDEEPEKPAVPWHYRKTVMRAAEQRLKDRNVTAGVTVAAAKSSAQVRVILLTPGADFPKNGYASTCDCQGAFESNIDPEVVGRQMVDDFLEKVEGERIK